MSLKPPVPHIIAGHALYPGTRAVSPVATGSGTPSDIYSGTPVAATLATGSGGTWSDPTWGTDSTFGAFVSLVTNQATTAYSRAINFAANATKYASGTLRAVVRIQALGSTTAVLARSGILGGSGIGDFCLSMSNTGVFTAHIRSTAQQGDAPITLTIGKWYALAATFESTTGALTLYAKNLTDGTATQVSHYTQADLSYCQVHSAGTGWGLGISETPGAQCSFDCAQVGWGGSTGGGAATPGSVWAQTDFENFAADPYGLVRPTLAVSPSSVAAGASNQAFTLTSNVGTYTPGTPGSPVATATGATLNTPQTVADSKTINVSVASTGAGGNSIVFTDPTYQVSATATVTTATATDFTLTPPSPANGNLGVASGAFSVAPNGIYTGTATLSDGGKGGTFSTAPTWSGESASKAFTYTPSPTGLAGPITITVTLPGLGSHSTTYTANATSLDPGVIARSAGTLTSITMDGHAGYGSDPNSTPTRRGGTAPAGGQGTLAIQWYQLPRADTPLAGDPGTKLAGQTGNDLALTGLAKFQPFIFVRKVTDGAASVAWSNVEVVSTLCAFKCGMVLGGDSITASMNTTEYANALQAGSNNTYVTWVFDPANYGATRTVPYWNTGMPGTYSSQWRPDSTGNNYPYPFDGVTTRNFIQNMKAVRTGQIGAKVDICGASLQLGINDVDVTSTTASQFAANISAACTDLLTVFDFVSLEYATEPISGPYGLAANRAKIMDFNAALDGLHNPAGNVFVTGNKRHLLMAGNADYHGSGGVIADPVHPNATGYTADAQMRAASTRHALESFVKGVPSASSGGSGGHKSIFGGGYIR